MIDTCYMGDTRDGLRAFAAAGIRAQTCVTSPPYWGLRDYGTAQWDGGDPACDHARKSGGERGAGLEGGDQRGRSEYAYRDQCGKCGARRIDRQLGLEPTPQEYVERMVEVFRLVRDVLADDGTLWLNLGDSYNNIGGTNGGGKSSLARVKTYRGWADGLKPKDLVGIPWRVAFALQADGWYLRSDIIWHKPNPMPESVTDRPTKSHEYLFLLAKSERYFYDAAAIAEKASGNVFNGSPAYAEELGGIFSGRDKSPAETRNKRTVWTVTTQPFADAHFAVFPPALIEPCIMAGTSARGHCPACGNGWQRVTERTAMVIDRSERTHDPSRRRSDGKPTCECNAGPPVPGVVLDPFLGSGTTAQVAQSLGRRWIGCELNSSYVQMQKRRTAQRGLELFA